MPFIQCAYSFQLPVSLNIRAMTPTSPFSSSLKKKNHSPFNSLQCEKDMSCFGALSLLLIILFASLINGGISFHGVENRSELMEPLIEPGTGWMVLNETRRRLGRFKICALCTCCGGPRRICVPSPCCYAINCNIPNKPFGFCSFTPKTCNCFGCHL